MSDPDKKPDSPLELLDAETNAWKWALERNNGSFDAEGAKRLHNSLHQYYISVMDTSHPAHKLLMEAEERNPDIRPRVSSFATKIGFGSKKRTNS